MNESDKNLPIIANSSSQSEGQSANEQAQSSDQDAYDRGYQEGYNQARQQQSSYGRQQSSAPNQALPSEGQFMSNKNFTYLLYGLFIGGYFTGGLTNIAALILAYAKRGDVTNTIFYSHMENVIHTTWITFWVGLFGGFLCFTVILAIIGWPLLAVLFIWATYRILKGFMRISDNRAYD